MPVDAALVAVRLGKPGDLCRPVADRDQKHPTVSAATQANTRDLAKWHVDHAAHSQLLRLTVSSHGEGSLLTSKRTYNHCLMISASFLLNSFRKMAMPAVGLVSRVSPVQTVAHARTIAAGYRPRGSPWSIAPSLP